MTEVTVFHFSTPAAASARTAWERVACVTLPAPAADDMIALDFAYERTQNIEGSWSQGAVLAGDHNPDFYAGTRVLAKLRSHLGRAYGHRSSMVGDVLCIDGARWYRVASFGFEPCEGLRHANIWARGYPDEKGPSDLIFTAEENVRAAVCEVFGPSAQVWNTGPACYPPMKEATPEALAAARAMTKGDNT